MFGTCKECSTEVGYFKLTDRVCETCLEKSDTRVSKFKRLRNSMPVLEWLFPLLILFQLASSWILQANVSGYPKVDALTNMPEISTQLVFSIILLIILSIPLTLSFIIRFFIVRRRLHIVFTWIVLIFLFGIPIGVLSALKGGEPLGLTSLFFPIVAFNVLRLDNILVGAKNK